jgi:hypothetical protein
VSIHDTTAEAMRRLITRWAAECSAYSEDSPLALLLQARIDAVGLALHRHEANIPRLIELDETIREHQDYLRWKLRHPDTGVPPRVVGILAGLGIVVLFGAAALDFTQGVLGGLALEAAAAALAVWGIYRRRNDDQEVDGLRRTLLALRAEREELLPPALDDITRRIPVSLTS